MLESKANGTGIPADKMDANRLRVAPCMPPCRGSRRPARGWSRRWRQASVMMGRWQYRQRAGGCGDFLNSYRSAPRPSGGFSGSGKPGQRLSAPARGQVLATRRGTTPVSAWVRAPHLRFGSWHRPHSSIKKAPISKPGLSENNLVEPTRNHRTVCISTADAPVVVARTRVITRL